MEWGALFGWGSIWFLIPMMRSCFSHAQLFVNLWTVACQAPLSMEFSRQENWSGLPCPFPGDLPDIGIKPTSLMSLAFLGRKALTNLHSMLKGSFASKGLSSQSYCFSSNHVWIWELDHKKGWAPKNWYFWTVMFAMTSAFSWKNSISLYPASFCTPKPNLPVAPAISWLPTFTSSPL